jgi:N-acetylneuraminate synthase
MPVYIIAEIGINHNGDLDIAKKLIIQAKGAGCDAVKFQKRTVDLVYPRDMLDSPRESPWGSTQREQKEGLEFGREEYDEIDRFCREMGIDWFASAWDVPSLEFLDRYGCPHAKVASAMNVHEEFCREVARRGVHTFISTAMATMGQVARCVDLFRAAGCPFTLMHCVATYPMRVGDANLRCIGTLREAFGCPVGYSGHEIGVAVSAGAVMLGAVALERHITLDRAMYGSDQPASLEGAGLTQLCRYTRILEAAMGDGVKRILPEEEAIARKLRGHLPTFADVCLGGGSHGTDASRLPVLPA